MYNENKEKAAQAPDTVQYDSSAAVYLCLCVSMGLGERGVSLPGEECMLYYIVNADGMKGLGHSILLVVDGEGCGRVFSFNGMQRTLGESLWERAAWEE